MLFFSWFRFQAVIWQVEFESDEGDRIDEHEDQFDDVEQSPESEERDESEKKVRDRYDAFEIVYVAEEVDDAIGDLGRKDPVERVKHGIDESK